MNVGVAAAAAAVVVVVSKLFKNAFGHFLPRQTKI
jgi:hypothetical protein